MPLISCADCGRDVSTAAAACPNCGRPMETAMEPLRLEWHDNNLTVNRSRDETFALCLAAAKLSGLKHGVGPNGISIAGKMWKHNGAAIGLVISPVTASSARYPERSVQRSTVRRGNSPTRQSHSTAPVTLRCRTLEVALAPVAHSPFLVVTTTAHEHEVLGEGLVGHVGLLLLGTQGELVELLDLLG